MRIVLIFSVVLIFYWLQREVYIRQCFKKVNASLKFEINEVFQGENLKLILTLVNKKFMPLWWLGVKYNVSRKIRFEEDKEFTAANDNYRKDIFFMMPYEKITKAYPIIAARRGHYSINEVELNSGDLFGDTRLLKKLCNNTELYVYPRLVEVEKLNIVFNKINGDVTAKRNLLEDPFQLRGIREYTPFDSLKSINWKATARSAELKVNQFSSTCSGGVTILLNVEKFNNFDAFEVMEEAVSITASLAAKYINMGINVEVITNGYDGSGRSRIRIDGGSTLNKSIEIYRELAELDTDNMEVTLLELINEEVTAKRNERVIILVSHFFNKEAVECYMEKRLKGFDIRWIAPVKDNINLPPEGIEELYCWEVMP